MRASALVLALSVLVVPVQDARADSVRVSVFGDSVLLGAANAIVGALPGDDVSVDARENLSLLGALGTLEAARPTVGDVVVLDLGYNDGTDLGAWRDRVDRAMAILADVPRVIWLTQSDFAPGRAEMNAELLAAASRYPNLAVADWSALVTAHPDFAYGDRVHLTPAGQDAMADLVRRHVDAFVAARIAATSTTLPPTTTSTTTTAPTTLPASAPGRDGSGTAGRAASSGGAEVAPAPASGSGPRSPAGAGRGGGLRGAAAPAAARSRRVACSPVETVDLAGRGGIRLRADRFGDLGGPPVLLLHGGGQTRHAWGSTRRRSPTAVAACTGRPPRPRRQRVGRGRRLLARGVRRRHPRRAGARCRRRRCSSARRSAGLVVAGRRSASRSGAGRPGAGARRRGADDRGGRRGAHRRVHDAARRAGSARSTRWPTRSPRYNPHRPRPTDLSGLTKNLRRRDDGRWVWHWDPRFVTGSSAPTRPARRSSTGPARRRARRAERPHAARPRPRERPAERGRRAGAARAGAARRVRRRRRRRPHGGRRPQRSLQRRDRRVPRPLAVTQSEPCPARRFGENRRQPSSRSR